MLRLFLSYFVFAVLFLTPAYAQDAGGLGGYVPPPLFGAPNFPDHDQKTKDLGLPVISKEVAPSEEEQAENELPTPIQTKRIIKEAPPEEAVSITPPTPKPAEKPKEPEAVKSPPIAEPAKAEVIKPAEEPKPAPAPVPKKAKAEKIPVKPGPEPIDLLSKEEIPPPPPFKDIEKIELVPPPKASSEGVVKGPKTMPAAKKQSVEAEVTFDKVEEPATDGAILERIQQEEIKEDPQKQEEAQAKLENIKQKIPLPSLVKQSDGSQKVTMLYTEKQAEVKDTQINTLEQIVIPAMGKNEDSRLIIEAYASSQDDSLNADRRLALSRALSIRDYIMSKNIASNRIDVRSLGAEGNIQPLDRVELIITP